MDSGAIHGNYISTEIALQLQALGATAKETRHTICNAFGECRSMVGEMDVILKLTYDTTLPPCTCTKAHTGVSNEMQQEQIEITCTIIQSPYDLIIGRPTIQQHNLLLKLHAHLMDKGSAVATGTSQQGTHHGPTETHDDDRVRHQLAAVYAHGQSSPGLVRTTMRTFLHFDPEAEGIDYPYSEQEPAFRDPVRPQSMAHREEQRAGAGTVTSSGYHQAPMAATSCALTAFITISGVYEFLRVPMGPKGAPR